MARYLAQNSCVFKESNGEWGIFSNFYNLPIQIGNITLKNTEYLYQILRFSNSPEHQQGLLDIRHQNTLYMKRRAKSRAYMQHNHPEFEANKLTIMEWIIRQKCAQHYTEMAKAFRASGKRKIIEKSPRDQFWGAIPTADGKILAGENHLGKILMKIRAEFFNNPNAIKTIPNLSLEWANIASDLNTAA